MCMHVQPRYGSKLLHRGKAALEVVAMEIVIMYHTLSSVPESQAHMS